MRSVAPSFVVIAVIASAAPTPAFAQTATCRAVEVPETESLAASPDDIAPKAYERLARSFRPFYENVNNAEFLFPEDEDPLRNPNEALYKWGITFSPGGLLRTAEDVERAWTSLATFHEFVRPLTVLEDGAPANMARGKGWGGWRKFVSAWSMGIAWSERAELTEKDRNERTVSFTFDPSHFASDGVIRKSGLGALAAYAKIAPRLAGLNGGLWQGHPCTDSTSVGHCLGRFAPDSSRGWNVLWLVPTVTFRMLDEFDYISQAGLLIPRRDGLEDRFTEKFELTWDLSKFVSAASGNRAAAVAALKTYSEIVKARATASAAAEPLALDTARLRPFTAGMPYYARLVPKKEGAYTFDSDTDPRTGDIAGFPGVQLHPDGVLLGLPLGADCGSSGCRFTVTVKAADKPVAVCEVALAARVSRP